jgi:methylated-DNA-[protein]-cysteine S-methyltransferase
MHTTILDTPIGRLELVAGDGALREIVLLDDAAGGAARGAAVGAGRADRVVLDEACRQLTEYFAGARRTFDLPLAPEGTAFQRRVWERLRAIGYGETVSYGALAAALDAPRAARAVGAACGRNPLPVVVPCHRVVGAAGDLRGFGLGGVAVKRRLLDLETGG